MAPIIVKNNITATGKSEVVVTAEMLQATSTGIAEAQLVFTVGLPNQGGLKLNGAADARYVPLKTSTTTKGFGISAVSQKATNKSALTNSLQAGKIDRKLDQSIAGGKIHAPVVVNQGTFADFAAKNPTNFGGANNPNAYFNYIGANSDNVDHFRLIGNNKFGVEDIYGGGDRDFNDLVVSMNVKT